MICRYRITAASVLSLFVLHIAVTNVSAAATEESMYQKARQSYYSLKKSAKKRKQRVNWLKVINNYEKTQKKYPGGKYGDKSLFMAAKLYKELNPYSGQSKDLKSSNKLLGKLIKNYPESNLADDAVFMMGENYEKMGYKHDAYRAYWNITKKYKKGDMIKGAKKKLSSLKKYAPVRKSSAAKIGKRKKKSPSAPLPKNREYTRVMSIRHWSNPNYTRIMVALDREAKYESHLLRRDPSIGKPPRLYLDIYNARKSGSWKEEEIPIHDGLLKKARVAQNEANKVRVVLDIESIKDFNIFPTMNPYGIIIDVTGDDVIRNPSIASLLPGDEKDKTGLKEAIEGEAISLSRQLGLGIRKIVIDPGHGGKDPGAIGLRRTKEKDVNLKIARELKKKLETDYNYLVVLTRNSDKFLELHERTAIANMENADLFVSLHVNANRNRRAFGMETYVMNARATDRYSAEVAARENAVTSNKMGAFGSILEKILVDMQKTNKVNESIRLASSIQKNMYGLMSKKYGSVKNLGIKKGPFYVLIGAKMPSVLVEVGFISNKMEEKRLRNKQYIDHLSESIAQGIDKYSQIIKTASNI